MPKDATRALTFSRRTGTWICSSTSPCRRPALNAVADGSLTNTVTVPDVGGPIRLRIGR
jgi:hypothetical protein